MTEQTDLKHPETMELESTSSLILCACELARNLESNLPNLANQPDMLSMSIDDIVKTFTDAKERLLFSQRQTPPSSSFARNLQPQNQIDANSTSLMQQWLIRPSGNCERPVDHQLVQMQQLQAPSMEAPPSRLRIRKNDSKMRTEMVPAPQFGNTEVPPEDGFTWRKYGQKAIFGSKHPRSYYRCTYQKLYKCPAKKQVQRLDRDPNIFSITYRGDHTCIVSSTAPSSSSIPPPQPQLPLDHNLTTQSATSASVSRWLLSAHLSLHGGAATVPGCMDAGSSGAGPSTSIYGGGPDYMVADLANAMFNSGSSSGNNSVMESLFPFTEDKWELGDKKSITL